MNERKDDNTFAFIYSVHESYFQLNFFHKFILLFYFVSQTIKTKTTKNVMKEKKIKSRETERDGERWGERERE